MTSPAVARAAATIGLDEIAWGLHPGRWPMPAATDAEGRWFRAVALAGQGRYSLATSELDVAESESEAARALRSVMASTRASWLRQTGAHTRAARYDGEAISLVGIESSADSVRILEARCDALTGLAADALGIGRLSTSHVLLARCSALLDSSPDSLWRPRLRLDWVKAELAMAGGDGPSAVRHALDARERATDTVSLRHRVKTELIVAAAQCSVGNVQQSVATAYSVLDACSEHELMPLRWAAAMLLNGLGEVTRARPIVEDCVAVLRRRGAVFAGV